MKQRWQEVTLDMPAWRPVGGVRLFFALSRTFTGEVRSPNRKLKFVDVRFPCVDLVWEGDGANPLKVELSVVGEDAELVEDATLFFTRVDDPESPFEVARFDVGPGGRRVVETGHPPEPIEEAVRRVLSSALQARRDYILANRPPRQDHLWFFFDLDHATLPILLKDGGNRHPSRTERRRLLVIQAVGQALQERIDARLARTVLPSIDADMKASLGELSRLQIPMYKRRLGACAGSVTAANHAFAEFASGRLFVSRELGFWNCGPNSAAYMQFAEFSLACIDAGVESDFWKDVLPAQVLSQTLYDRAFPHTAGRRPLRPTVPVPDADVARVVAECANTGYPAVVAEHEANLLRIIRP